MPRRTTPAQVWEFSKNTALLQLERRNQQLMEQVEAFGAERLQHAAAVEKAKAAAVDAARGAVQHELSAAEQRAVYLRARMLARSEATVQAATRATRLRTAFHILRLVPPPYAAPPPLCECDHLPTRPRP
jgi:hypothetical protein